MSNFHSFEVVGRGSETQLQMGENLNKIPWYVKGEHFYIMTNQKHGDMPGTMLLCTWPFTFM